MPTKHHTEINIVTGPDFLRCALFLVFACNTQADPSINLVAISSVGFGLTVVTHYTDAVYRNCMSNFLRLLL